MSWTIEYAQSAQKSVRKLDQQVQRRLRDFLEGRIARIDNPRQLGAALQGTGSRQLWRYRVGDYRVITEIDDESIRILVLRVGHRRHVYR